MINSERITVLLQRFAEGEIDKADYQELISYFNLKGNDEEIYTAMDEVWKNSVTDDSYLQADEDLFYKNLVSSKEFKRYRPKSTFKLWYRYAAAAVILIALSFGLFYSDNFFPSSNEGKFAKNDISPGGNKAILTLASGRTIDLSDANNGQLADEIGIAVTKTKSGQVIYTIKKSEKTNTNASLQYNTISTPRGGQYQVNLPDGTMVWLNAESSVKFPVQFSGTERKVSLTGEAYFEVAKVYKDRKSEERLPFLVTSNDQTVEVFGTHFNINAYEDNTITTLLEGSVKVSALQTPKLTSYLKPGQQSILNAKKLLVNTADLEEAMAWKSGLFMFNGQNLGSIMKQVERWYNVEVVFADEALKQEVFNGTTSRFKNISQLLQVLETTGSIHFKIEGRRIIAMQ
jgi:transmembrane sensor